MSGYSPERKVAVLKKILPHPLSVAESSRQEGISDVTLYTWRKQAIARGEKAAGDDKSRTKWSAEAKLTVV
jgi:transposase